MTAKKQVVEGEGERKFLGRTGKDWAKFCLYYFIFYSILTAFWYGVYRSFFTIFNDKAPNLQLGESRIGKYPAIVIKPDQDEDHRSSKFYRLNLDFPKVGGKVGGIHDHNNIGYATRAKDFLDRIESSGLEKDFAVDCQEYNTTAKTWSYLKNNVTVPKKKQQWCHLNTSEVLGRCGEFPYGFGYVYEPNPEDIETIKKLKTREECLGWEPEDSHKLGHRKTISPCFIIKVNRVFNFDFKPFNSAKQIKKMKGMPGHLKKMVTDEMVKRQAEVKAKTGKDKKMEFMYVDCKGMHPEDQEALSGSVQVVRFTESNSTCDIHQVPRVEYYPENQGISRKYFPYNNKKNKENAIMAVRFNDLKVGQLIQVQCTVFYPGSDSDEALEDYPEINLTKFQVFVNDENDFVFN